MKRRRSGQRQEVYLPFPWALTSTTPEKQLSTGPCLIPGSEAEAELWHQQPRPGAATALSRTPAVEGGSPGVGMGRVRLDWTQHPGSTEAGR